MKKIFSNTVPFIVVGLVVFAFIWFYSEKTGAVNQANEAYMNREYRKAIELYESKRMSLNHEEVYRLANSYSRIGNVEHSLRIYEELSKSKKMDNNELAVVYLSTGDALAESGNIEEALSYYDKAIKKATKLQIKTDAKKAAGFLISAAPTDETAEKGIKYLMEVGSTNSERENPDITYRIGKLIDYVGDTEYAIRYWEKTLKLDHTYIKAYKDIGYTLLDNGSYNEAKKVFDKVISYEPNDASAYSGIGEVYEKTGNEGQAIRYYQNAISLDPNSLASRMGLSRIYLKNQDKGAATEQLYQVVRLSPDSAYGKEAKEILQEILPKLAPVPASGE